MFHYEDPIDVLEALGYDPAFGSREWIDSYHVDDLRALSQALFYSQMCEVRWDRTVVNGDPFGRALRDLGDELMIEVKGATVLTPREVSPSFYTWRPGGDYIVYKICEFFGSPRIDGMDAISLQLDYSKDRRYVSILAGRSVYGPQGTNRKTLVKIPLFHEYLSSAQLKGDLMRYMFEALAEAERDRVCGYSIGYRPLYATAVQFIDAVWGSIPELEVA